MQHIYFGTILAAMIIFLLNSLLLFSQRKEGERSRTLFACINFISVLNCLNEIIHFEEKSSPFVVMPVTLLLLGIFVITTYSIYPIEVISPGWFNWKRILKIYTPVACLILFYKITLWMGVVYTPFESIADLVSHIDSFEVLFRIALALLIFLPALLLYFVPYTRKYNNTDCKWMYGYIIVVIVNGTAFLAALSSDVIVIRTLYYLVSISCSLYLTYQELFVRLIKRSKGKVLMESNSKQNIQPEVQAEPMQEIVVNENSQISSIFSKLEEYINQTQAWRNPDLSVGELTGILCTNRNYLREAIQQQGYEGYTSYINSKRIAEFIRIIEEQGGNNYLQTFFDVGFRSKTTALRNFRDSIGTTPSEYFQKHTQPK